MNREQETKVAFKLAFLFFGVILIFVGIFLMNLHFKERKYYETTQGVIVDIVKDTYVDVDETGVYSETESTVYVDYVVDGVKYEYIPLNRYSFTMSIGDIVDVTYDRRNPGYVTSKNGMIIGSVVCLALGSGFMAAFLIPNLRSHNRQISNKEEQ